MPYCKKCGRRLGADAKFCPKCGTPVVAEAVKEAVREPQKRRLGTGNIWLTIVGAIAIIFGLGIKGKAIIQYQGTIPTGYISLEPFGWLFIAIGVAAVVFGIFEMVNNI
ncbi:MAG: zinc-ribbon domain-containing protein [Candidatus Hadarchaeum sp.]|jgi:uncharacterized membrane protein HdeD (DUF308 family)|nr:zinc-ribbon domain-containing protein [Candidatus Hadarchaeum sp.]